MEAVSIIKHNQGSENQGPVTVGDSECFDDVERPVGCRGLLVDIFDVRGHESGRNTVYGKLDVSGASQQFRSRPTADGCDGRVYVRPGDDFDVSECYPGVLEVTEPDQHCTSLEQLHHQTCPELLGVREFPELPVLGLEWESPSH